MLNGYSIIDADSHVIEPPTMWAEYLEPEFKQFAPSPEMRIKGEEIVEKVSQLVRDEGNKQMMEAHPNAYFKGYDVESHVQEMVQMGVDLAFLYPTYGLWLWAIDDMAPEVAGAFTRAYNRWLVDYCSYDPERLRGVGAINLHAPEQMMSELHHVAELGWKAVFLRPNPVKGRLLSDSAYEPFWRACEELGVSIGIHEGTHGLLPTAGAERFKTRFALHACSHPMEQMMAFLTLIEGGVLERHPDLRVAFLEAGCSWLPYWSVKIKMRGRTISFSILSLLPAPCSPAALSLNSKLSEYYWLWRLDEEYENLFWEVADTVKMKPSEYFRRQCFISVEPSEPNIAEVIQSIGTENLLFGSDYPHVDHKPDVIDGAVDLEKYLLKETVQNILWDNSARFYGVTQNDY